MAEKGKEGSYRKQRTARAPEKGLGSGSSASIKGNYCVDKAMAGSGKGYKVGKGDK